ncbi:MAG: 3,4-dihydroxy-2-butanone-4-phosphate synthase [Pseudomonadota bacterium]|nr:3,4-dihydroxy-2-butanone-4-phosphate synthase [Pseudomonadota bacterium]
MAKEKYLSSIEEIIDDARNGKMFILIDDENRENEGDLVIPAQMATPDAINFMAKNGRGLICLALTQKRIDELQLTPMTTNNTARYETAFTTSIESKEGVTTGISASDRARTVATAIDPTKGHQDICTPGHIFPLACRDGGVLVRAGHTEASVDIARLSGLNPSGVICEIMNEDGSMARTHDLIKFAKKHKIKIATIADLISFRLRNDKIVRPEVETEIKTIAGGEFRTIIYRNIAESSEHMALVKGDLTTDEPALVRMHAFNVFDYIHGVDKTVELHRAMEIIANEGRGVVVLIRSASVTDLSDYVTKHVKNMAEDSQRETESAILLKDYGVGAQILRDLGVREMILLSNRKHSIVGLDGHNLKIIEQRQITYPKDYDIPLGPGFYE